MDDNLKKEVLDVRRVIEKSTSKVSLRDLEKKGFRQVKVLRAGDINQLIFKAVQNVLAKQPRGAGMSEEEQQRIMREARADVDRQLAEKRAIQQQAQQIEEAKARLEAKVAELNTQMARERQAFESEKAAFTRDKQALMERSLEGQKSAQANYQGQIDDLRARLARAEAQSQGAVSPQEHQRLQQQLAETEARLKESVPREEHDSIRQRYATQLEDLENDVDRYRKQLRSAEEESGDALNRAKRRVAELEEAEARAQSRVKSLQDDVDRLEAEVARLREELAEAAATSGSGKANDAEMQRMRMQLEQHQVRVQEMMAGLANTLIEARNAAPAVADSGGGDLSKQFKQLQLSITDAVRKAAGAGGRGGDMGFDLTAEQAAALFATQEDVKLDTNINDIKVKEQSAAGVKDKLAKLRNLRKQ